MIPLSNDRDLLTLLQSSAWHMTALRVAAAMKLPDCWIGAGFVRAPVWDALHGFDRPTPLSDLDVIYFDREVATPERDETLEQELRARAPCYPWSVRNQARMHRRNGDRPYRSTADALCHWLETPTAVAVRLASDGQLELLAPLGLADLLALRLRPTPHARQRRLAAYQERLAQKPWRHQWPRLQIDDG
ncbi:MAG: nucleotidyltransferase family protein [Pseudomonadota bacterium]